MLPIRQGQKTTQIVLAFDWMWEEMVQKRSQVTAPLLVDLGFVSLVMTGKGSLANFLPRCSLYYLASSINPREVRKLLSVCGIRSPALPLSFQLLSMLIR